MCLYFFFLCIITSQFKMSQRYVNGEGTQCDLLSPQRQSLCPGDCTRDPDNHHVDKPRDVQQFERVESSKPLVGMERPSKHKQKFHKGNNELPTDGFQLLFVPKRHHRHRHMSMWDYCMMEELKEKWYTTADVLTILNRHDNLKDDQTNNQKKGDSSTLH
jgi:hypothetical protein